MTDDPDLARDTLEEVLTNDRADLPAVAQRRHLASQEPPLARETAEERVAAARRALAVAQERAEPQIRLLRDAEHAVAQAQSDVWAARRVADDAPVLRRRAANRGVTAAESRLAGAQEQRDHALERAAPHLTEIHVVEDQLRNAERDLSSARLLERMDALVRRAPERSFDRGIGIEL